MKTILKVLAWLLTLTGLTLNPAQAAAPVTINDYLGDWSATAGPYAAGNVVSYSSKTWLSLVNGNTKKPSADGTTSQWRLLGDAKTFAYKVGDKGPGGGWIFFVDWEDKYPGFTYLEAAPQDVAGGKHQWCYPLDVSIPGASGPAAEAIGRGKSNTEAMLKVCSSGAANAVAAYRGPRNKTDWFLPSRLELALIYRLFFQKLGPEPEPPDDIGFASLWSSSEAYGTSADSRLDAWFQSYPGFYAYARKSDTFRVRPIRAF